MFLDSRRPGPAGNCALRCALPGRGDALVSAPFPASPALYVSADFVVQALFDDAALGRRFRRLEKLKTPLQPDPEADPVDFQARDVAPTAGRLVMYRRGAEIPQTRRGDAAVTCIFRGEESRRRRGCYVDIPCRRSRRGDVNISRRGVAATPRLLRGYAVETE